MKRLLLCLFLILNVGGKTFGQEEPIPPNSNLIGCGGGITMADLAGEYDLEDSNGDVAGILFSDTIKAQATLEANGDFTLELESATTLSLVIRGTSIFREIGLYITLEEFEGVDKSDGQEYSGTIEDLLTTVRFWSMAGFCQYIGSPRFPSRYYWNGDLAGRVFFERK